VYAALAIRLETLAGRFDDDFGQIDAVVGHQQEHHCLGHVRILQSWKALVFKPISIRLDESTSFLYFSRNSAWTYFLRKTTKEIKVAGNTFNSILTHRDTNFPVVFLDEFLSDNFSCCPDRMLLIKCV
jgi:hypothetical protein